MNKTDSFLNDSRQVNSVILVQLQPSFFLFHVSSEDNIVFSSDFFENKRLITIITEKKKKGKKKRNYCFEITF